MDEKKFRMDRQAIWMDENIINPYNWLYNMFTNHMDD